MAPESARYRIRRTWYECFECAELSRGIAVAEVFEMDADVLKSFGNRTELLLVNVREAVNCLCERKVIGGGSHV